MRCRRHLRSHSPVEALTSFSAFSASLRFASLLSRVAFKTWITVSTFMTTGVLISVRRGREIVHQVVHG